MYYLQFITHPPQSSCLAIFKNTLTCDGENGSVFTGVLFSATLTASLHKPSFRSVTGDCPTRNLFFFLRIAGGLLNLFKFEVDEKTVSSSPLMLLWFLPSSITPTLYWQSAAPSLCWSRISFTGAGLTGETTASESSKQVSLHATGSYGRRWKTQAGLSKNVQANLSALYLHKPYTDLFSLCLSYSHKTLNILKHNCFKTGHKALDKAEIIDKYKIR